MIFLSFMNLFRNYRRTLAILLTVALGTGVLFAFKGFINGVLDQYRESTIHALYGHGQVNTKYYRESVYAEPWKHWINNQEQIEQFLVHQNNVRFIFPRINFPAFLKRGNITVSGYGQGINAVDESKFFYNLNVETGQTLSDQPNGILLGIGLAKALQVNPGDYVRVVANSIDGPISETDLVVTGIFNTGSLDFDNHVFRIQLKEAQALLHTDSVELISIGLQNYQDWHNFAKTFQQAFPDMEATSFAVLDKVYYQNSIDWLHAQFNVIQIIILSIVLLGIFNSVSSAILERKQEIGNFRANGESVGDVIKLILFEGVFLGVLGSIVGIVLTYIVLNYFVNHRILMPPGPGQTRPFYIAFEFEWNMVYSTIALSMLATVLASAIAGIRVAKMPIAKALRSY